MRETPSSPSNDSETDFNNIFFALPPTLSQTPPTRKDAKRKKIDSGCQSPPGVLPETSGKYNFGPSVSFSTTHESSPISHFRVSGSPYPLVNSSTEVTLARSLRDENLSVDEHWEKIYRTRIVDFVVVYLEGKRLPSHEASGAEFERELNGLLQLGRKDIDTKRPFFFEVYPCISFVGIAFAGPYWQFSICNLTR
ncbi:hypothetical protein B0J17DRAFT_722203 [Rhizoctonia solani]|nr:hypothetical protein B0J17DRAFT_722203 [Rhizoctonia solani]